MNCRRTRELLTPYSDGRLTGVQMLEVAQHMDRCAGCRDEYRVIQEVKALLRAVSRPQPAGALEYEIRKRIATEEAISQINLCLSFSVRPQRAKRIATAMALSCISVLAVAAPFGAGTLALTYSNQAEKNSGFNVARSRHQELPPMFGAYEGNNFSLFAFAGMPMTDTSRHTSSSRHSDVQSGYDFMAPRNQSYGTFASQELTSFNGPQLGFPIHR
ncbi:MAG: hypothetical protein JWQ02_1555 [Capsulimonas sp.]|nr:hypothetical protein [Capsulimonas sp.]